MGQVREKLNVREAVPSGARAVEQWYVLRTVPEKERQAAELLKQAVDHGLWTYCRSLKKGKVFRSGGKLHLLEEPMFPGYLFVKTAYPEELAKELEKARKFPQMVGKAIRGTTDRTTVGITVGISAGRSAEMIPVETSDLEFLKTVCGEELQTSMGISKIILSGDSHIVSAEGVLNRYLDRIVKLNIRKRFAIVEVELFHRRQEVLFGVWLEKDRAG